MKAKIIGVSKELLKSFVTFSTEFGDAKALWNGDVPEVGKEYFVELEIPDVLTWGTDIILSDKEEYTIGMDGNWLYMIGVLESVEEDGYSVIRLGESIVPLESEGDSLTLGAFVRLKTNNATLYNVNY